MQRSVIAVATMLGLVVMTMPLIFAVKGWGAWQSLPRDIYAPYQQRILGVRPSRFWVAIMAVSLVTDLFKYVWLKSVVDFLSLITLIFMGFLLAAHLRRSGKLLEKGQTIDGRLLRFAKYTFGWCATLLLLILSSSLVSLISKSSR